MPDVALDADVLVKCSAYGLLQQATACLICGDGNAALLGSTKYTVLARLKRATLEQSPIVAESRFLAFLQSASLLEPTSEEGELAADLEFEAQKMALALDAGESQLAAIVIVRAIPLLVTGDKRAIRALEALVEIVPAPSALISKIACLEQLFITLLGTGDTTAIRDAVCSERHVDKSASICFACHSSQANVGDWLDALNSYVAALRADAPKVLMSDF